MEIELIDKEKGEEKSVSSESSINSNPEFKQKKFYCLRISLIIINIISIILGFFICQNKEYYLSIDYKFDYFFFLFIFIILYSFGMISSLIISFLLFIIIKILIFIINFCSNISNSLKQKNKKESNKSINSYSNQISLLSYSFSLFIVITCIIYFISLPYSIFLLYFMNKNKFYSNYKVFLILYFFIIINAFSGLILLYVLLITIFSKRKGSVRKRQFFIDDNKLNKIEKEIKEAMEKAN